jgi:hypothetical protein
LTSLLASVTSSEEAEPDEAQPPTQQLELIIADREEHPVRLCEGHQIRMDEAVEGDMARVHERGATECSTMGKVRGEREPGLSIPSARRFHRRMPHWHTGGLVHALSSTLSNYAA